MLGPGVALRWSLVAAGYGMFAVIEKSTGDYTGETGLANFCRGLGENFDDFGGSQLDVLITYISSWLCIRSGRRGSQMVYGSHARVPNRMPYSWEKHVVTQDGWEVGLHRIRCESLPGPTYDYAPAQRTEIITPASCSNQAPHSRQLCAASRA